MSKKISGERLDVVLDRLRQSGETDAAGKPIRPEEFASILAHSGIDERKAQGGDSLETEILDFTIPRITEPGIFQASKSIMLLEHFLADLLPTLDESEELRILAARVIGDEISRQRDVLDRLQAGLAA